MMHFLTVLYFKNKMLEQVKQNNSQYIWPIAFVSGIWYAY